MPPLVVDASIAVMWFIPEPHSPAAQRLLTGRRPLIAPDLLAAEFGNALWKRARRGELSADEAREMATDFVRLPLELVDTRGLLAAALELALSSGRTVYDCTYLALAIERASRLVTADERLVNALAGTPLARHVRWIGATR